MKSPPLNRILVGACACLLSVANVTVCLAQAQFSADSSANRTLDFDLDTALFRYDENRVYVEVYYGISSDQLQVVDDGHNTVSVDIELKIYADDSLYSSRQWSTKSVVSEDRSEHAGKIVSLTKVVLNPGTYSLSTRVADLGSGATGRRDTELVAQAIPDDSLATSEIELAYSVAPDTGHGLYSKNNYKVLPNPDALYDVNHPILYFYAEVYNLGLENQSSYTVQHSIEDVDHTVVKVFPEKTRALTGSSIVEVGGFNVVSLPTGAYYLKLQVTDDSNQAQALRRKKFYVYGRRAEQARAPGERLSALSQYYQSLSESQIVEEFEMARYIASDNEKRVFETLDLAGKRTFLARFWNLRDSQAGVPTNQFRMDYLTRVRAANQRYTTRQNLGWKTDRGRVIIVYGEPDEIERNPSISETLGFERWYYRTSKREMIFVFVRKRGWDEMELVHSTARGEVYDPDWERWISVR